MGKGKVILGGPVFAPAEDDYVKSSFDKEGAHYNIYRLKSEDKGIEYLYNMFPQGIANEYNIVLFSTSGVHGSYKTIEGIEESLRKYGNAPDFLDSGEQWPDDWSCPELTFLVIQPRIVSMTYGNLLVTLDDISFLKKLRKSSWQVVSDIGK